MYQYPYGNAQQLNLDWILSKIQELEAGSTEVNIEEVANALIAASFDAGVSYRRYDYCFYNGKLYRALNDNTGAFNPSDWLEVVIGDDIPVLTRLLNAVDTSLTSLQNTVNDLDSDDVDNASNVTGTTVTDALETLATALGDLDSDDVDNASNVTGTTVTDALDNLNGAITNATNYKTGDSIPIAGMYASISNSAATTISCSIQANKIIPSGRTYTLSRLPDWIRGNQLASISHFTFTLHAITRLDDYTFILVFDITPLSGVTIPSADNFITYFSAGTIYIS